MSKYNFDEMIERRGTGAIKADCLSEMFGRDDIIPAWVADMDFATPPFILEALRKRLEHPVLGYTAEPADYRQAIIDWQKKLHDWDVEKEWISYIPGIVKGIGMVLNVFTKPGEEVYIMPPVYHPFRIVPKSNGRKVVNIPLKEGDDCRYHMDYEALEKLPGGGVLILSNPHNPAGQIWTRDELARLAEICGDKGMIVISDEIHADMAHWGKKHIPFAKSCQKAAGISITFGAPSKTFNIPGVVSSFSVVSDKTIRDRFYGWLAANEFDTAPIFSYIATVSAYREGWEWRKEMLEYIEANIEYIIDFCKRNIPGVIARRPDASFLVWLDCRGLGLDHDELVDLFVGKAGLALNDGEMFGAEGKGFMRLNVAEPRSVIETILIRLKDAAARLK